MRRSLWLAAVCLLAFALSWAYLGYYLRGGPRIIDATSYFLEARSIAAGAFQFLVPEPTGAFRGRFLLAQQGGHALGVIFPPGYPLVLAIGFWLGAPLLVGPALGALLVAATYLLARALTGREDVAKLAALLSALTAALRYHTADTMSHGLSALLLTLGLALCVDRSRRSHLLLLSGLCLGLLLATRPVSGVVAVALCGLALGPARPRSWLWLFAGALPGVALLVAHQRALTGDFFSSTQLAYYASADAPANCFRYGFGPGIGCRFEHGDFVERFLPTGYGFRAAARNALLRLGLFGVDATNAAPLSLLGLYAAYRHVRSPLSLLTLGIVLQCLAYVPFYFDGNYPGGGARFLCEVIPLCQVLVATAAVDLKVGRLVAPASIAGFLLHARHGHQQLRDREGGRPMFEPAVLAQAGVTRGLLFVGTDHGFNLGHDPAVTSPSQGVVVARRRSDAHDRELYERLGRPTTFRYEYSASEARPPRVSAYVPPASARYEAEAEWPALVSGGGAYPIRLPCASGGAALRVFPGGQVTLPRGGSGAGQGSPEMGWASTRPGTAVVSVSIGNSAPVEFSAIGPGCSRWRLGDGMPVGGGPVVFRMLRGEGAIDYVSW